MSSSRKPSGAMRQPRASAALLIAILALLAALTGGSYAAGHYLGATASRSKAQVGRGPRGPRGEPGLPGLLGPAGRAGSPGDSGAPGFGVTGAELKPGNQHCPEGGTEFKTASGTAFACNGARGPEGKTGPVNVP